MSAFEELKACYEQSGKMLLCGNGGSAADCEHIVGELMKGFTRRRPVPQQVRERLQEVIASDEEPSIADRLQGALPAISLVSQSGIMTAYANDVDAEMVFAQQVYGYGTKGDVLLGITTSGNSRNVLQALKVARSLGMRTIGLTGQTGGRMASLCDVCICVPYVSTADVQERHLPIYHSLCTMLEEAFFA
ncbi:D-sedoheptulose-7-phosphate isomerase [Paenibacillus sp. UNC451MF]|uniref:D-sedoheptulose-7-phosphate isomerase n=1 Tax=Paenibacillus sp. UNC451MF TaxID=1449063 RepID=UPI000A6F2A9F|nr:SIS domain-containing protein [Paenibacillus sp. UNC451MF]